MGVHGGELWPEALDGEPYRFGQPLCALGAIAVVRGARTAWHAMTVLAVDDPAVNALVRFVGGQDRACVSAESDRWSRRGRLGQRVVVFGIRRAARSCRG